jgi:hypothetical protein
MNAPELASITEKGIVPAKMERFVLPFAKIVPVSRKRQSVELLTKDNVDASFC